jgi:tetratricopeptide (TPR) repeat protein
MARAYFWYPTTRSKAQTAFEKALARATADLKLNPNDADAQLLASYYSAMLGKRAAALQHLNAAIKLHPEDAETAYFGALVEEQLGDRKQTLDWLAKAAARGYSLQQIASTIEFDSLKSDPRFPAIIAR